MTLTTPRPDRDYESSSPRFMDRARLWKRFSHSIRDFANGPDGSPDGPRLPRPQRSSSDCCCSRRNTVRQLHRMTRWMRRRPSSTRTGSTSAPCPCRSFPDELTDDQSGDRIGLAESSLYRFDIDFDPGDEQVRARAGARLFSFDDDTQGEAGASLASMSADSLSITGRATGVSGGPTRCWTTKLDDEREYHEMLRDVARSRRGASSKAFSPAAQRSRVIVGKPQHCCISSSHFYMPGRESRAPGRGCPRC